MRSRAFFLSPMLAWCLFASVVAGGLGGFSGRAEALTSVMYHSATGCYVPVGAPNSTTLAAAIAELTWDACLLVPRTMAGGTSGNWTITGNLTIPSRIALHIENGPRMAVETGVTLTFASCPRAGRYQIFGGVGTVAMATSTCAAYPEWFGAVGDGATDDSASFVKLFAAAPPTVALASERAYVVCGLDVTTPMRIIGQGTLKTLTGCSVNTPLLTLSSTADGSYLDLRIDGNGGEPTGVLINGADRVEAHVEGWDIEPLAGCASQSVVRVAGGKGNRLYVQAHDLVHNVLCANASVPRGVGVGGDAEDTYITGVFTDSGGSGIVVGASTNTEIANVVISNVEDNGIYGVDGCVRLTITGGSIRLVEEGIVIKCAGAVVTGTKISNVTVEAIGIQDASDVLINGVHYLDDAEQADTSHIVMSARTANVTSTRITIKNMYVNTQMGTGQIPFRFVSGTVNQLKFLDNDITIHWTANSTGEEIFEHTTGDSLWFDRNVVRMIDDTATLTDAELFRIKVPTVTAWSSITDNTLLTDDAGDATLFIQDTDQNLFTVRHLGHARVVATNQSRLGALNFATGKRCKVMYGTAVPTEGTWNVCDEIRNTEPVSAANGAACNNNSVILKWVNTVAGTPGTWLPIYGCL